LNNEPSFPELLAMAAKGIVGGLNIAVVRKLPTMLVPESRRTDCSRIVIDNTANEVIDAAA
jgi:hypothetical protein